MKDKIDNFSRLVRPVFGMIVALSWGAQMFAVAFVILFKSQAAAAIINAMGSLGPIWAIGLSVLGIYVYRRSSEKMKGSTE